MKSLVYQSQSEGITKAIGGKLASQLTTGGVVLLHGDLGSGKTTFVQGIADALLVEQPVTSPTFTILNTYPLAHSFLTQLVHIDLYRVQHQHQIDPLDLLSLMNDPTVLMLVEWPERLHWEWPNVLGELYFASEEMHHHTITIEGDIAESLR